MSRWISFRLRRVVLVVAVFAVVAAAGYGWRWFATPQPPAVSYAEADPAVVQVIEAARSDVWWRPRSAAAWGRLGQLLRAHTYYSESNTCFARAEELDPKEPRWPYLHGVNLLASDPEAAVPHLARAAALCDGNPDTPELRLAEALLLLGRLDEAETALKRVVGRDPENARARLDLGRLARERGLLPEAVAQLERAAASTRTRQTAHALLAQVHREQSDAAEAVRQRERAAELPPDAPWPDPFLEETRSLMAGRQARLARIQTLRRQGRLEEMQRLAQQVELDYPDLYWLIEGREQRVRGDLRAAEAALRKSVALAPDGVDALFDLGSVLLEKKDHAAATECFAKIAALEPGHGPARRRLGLCRLAQGDRAAAVEEFRAALAASPQDGETHRDLGALLAEQGQVREALKHLRQAVRLRPDDSKARELLEEVSRQVAASA